MTLHTLTPELRATFRILYWDIFWIGILVGTTLSFQGVYATRLGPAAFSLACSPPGRRWSPCSTRCRPGCGWKDAR